MDKHGNRKTSFEELYSDLRPLFFMGLLKEVYKNDECLVCNCCNASYITFMMIKNKYGQVGFTCNSDMVKKIADIPGYLYALYSDERGQKFLEEASLTVRTDKKFVEDLRKLQVEYRDHPDPSINFEMEEQLAARSKQL